jgi:hypothetical protein
MKSLTKTTSFSIAILILLSVSCSQRSQANPATATIQAQGFQRRATQMANRIQATDAVLAPQATSQAQLLQNLVQEASNWPLIISDKFADNSHQWPTGTDDGNLSKVTINIDNGKLHWEAHAKESFIYWAYPSIDPVKNFYLSIEGEIISGPDTEDYGVAFRMADADNYYLFRIDRSQEYELEVRINAGWTTLIDWTSAPAIHSSGLNRITIIGKADQFVFLINNQIVTNTSLTQIDKGQAGVVIGIYDKGENGVFEFDDFEFRSSD